MDDGAAVEVNPILRHVTHHFPVSVGYRYSDCPRIVWDTQSVMLPGAELVPSRLGQWSIDKVHAYDYERGVLHRGDGATEYLSQRPWTAEEVPLSTPSGMGFPAGPTLTVTALGHLILAAEGGRLRLLQVTSSDVADVSAARTLLDLPASAGYPAAVHQLASDPSSLPTQPVVYVSDPTRRQIRRLTLELGTDGGPVTLRSSQTVPLPADALTTAAAAAEGASALTVDRRGVVYFADGPNIRRLTVVALSSPAEVVVETVAAGTGGTLAGREPWPCESTTQSLDQARLPLRWPSALACNPVDDSVHFLDDQSVFRIAPDGFVHLVAGRPPHCPPQHRKEALSARHQTLRSPRAIAFTPQGELLVLESRGPDRLRVLRTDGRLHAFPVDPESRRRLLRLQTPSAIAVSPLGDIFVAAGGGPGGLLRIRHRQPRPDPASRNYRVTSRDLREEYTFNLEGKHLTTRDVVTGAVKYSFEHSNYDTSLTAPVRRIHQGGRVYELRHDYHNATILTPSGRTCVLAYGDLGQTRSLDCHGNGRYRFRYDSAAVGKSRGCVTALTAPGGRRWLFEYAQPETAGPAGLFGRLTRLVGPTGVVGSLRVEIESEGLRVRWATVDGSSMPPWPLSLIYNGGVTEFDQSLGVTASLNSVSATSDGSLLGDLRCPAGGDCSVQIGDGADGAQRRLLRLNGDSVAHLAEWAFGHAAAEGGSNGWMTLKVNNQSVLTVKFDQQHLSEAYYLSGSSGSSASASGDLLFTIAYNAAGQPLSVMPNPQICLYRPVHFKYTTGGQISEMRWADKPRTASESIAREGSVQWQYDSRGRLVSEIRNFSQGGAADSGDGGDATEDLSVYQFSYLDNSSMPGRITDPAGHVYHFERDPSGGLLAVGTPSSAPRSEFRLQTSLGVTRLLYWPWPGPGVVFEFDSEDALVSLTYPSRRRRLTNVYLPGYESGRRLVRRLLDDGSGTSFEYDPTSGLPAAMATAHAKSSFSPSCLVTLSVAYGNATGPLPIEEAVVFGDGCQLRPVRHSLAYDANLRVASVVTGVGTARSVVNTTYHPTRGHVASLWGDLSATYAVSRSGHSVSLADRNSSHKFSFDSLGRLVEATLFVASSRVFVLSVHGYSRGRVQELVYIVGKESAHASVAYSRDSRSRVTAVASSTRGVPTGRETLVYRPDGRYARRSLETRGGGVTGNQTYEYAYDSRGMPTTVGSAEYQFDADGFLSRRRGLRSTSSPWEEFRFDALGLLSGAECPGAGGYRLRYLYDGRQHLVARLDLLDRRRDLQLLYADPSRPDRVSHAYYPHEDRLVAFAYEDRTGQLVAMETAGRRYYVACDRLGSPLAVFNSTGDTVLRLAYTHTGRVLKPTVDSLLFHFPFGYLGGLHDPDTELVLMLPGNRAYDPVSGQWATPDHLGLLKRLSAAQSSGSRPQAVEAYAFDPWLDSDTVYDPEVVGRPEFWLGIFNLDARRLLAEPWRRVTSSGGDFSSPARAVSVLTEALSGSLARFAQRVTRMREADRPPLLTTFNATAGVLPTTYQIAFAGQQQRVSVGPAEASDVAGAAAAAFAEADRFAAAAVNGSRWLGCATEGDRHVCRFVRDRRDSVSDAEPPAGRLLSNGVRLALASSEEDGGRIIRLEGELATYLISFESAAGTVA